MELLRDRAVESSIQQPQRPIRVLHKPPVLSTLVGYTSRMWQHDRKAPRLGYHRNV
ncbi:hypothetical protein QR685DRAFT_528914 [Neurospora intermedia]|uniref:Uncharacterized protein n=1 Tax=Neurospora intermedia TaxID=5142 RepID=A0ABR3D889_NEUIN